MPGLFGAVSSQPAHDVAGLGRRMRELLRHHSWYGGYLHADGDACLGALSTSPHFSPEENYCVLGDRRAALEGHVRRVAGRPPGQEGTTLAKQVIHLFQRLGDDFVEKVEGSFNLALYDTAAQRLLIGNDRFGYAPLYYYHSGDLLLFGPEPKAFLAFPRLDMALDEGALALYLAGRGLVSDRTFLERVRLLPPGALLEFQAGKVRLTRTWSPRIGPPSRRRTADIAADALETCAASLRSWLPGIPYDRLYVPLSGGLSSRLLLGLLEQQGAQPSPITWGEQNSPNWRIACRVATACGRNDRHQRIMIDPARARELAPLAVWLSDGQAGLAGLPLLGIADELGPGRVPFVHGGARSFPLPVGEDLQLLMAAGHDPACWSRPEDVFQAFGLAPDQVGFETFLRAPVAKRFAALARELAWHHVQDCIRHVEPRDQMIWFLHSQRQRRAFVAAAVVGHCFYQALPLLEPRLLDLWCELPVRLRREGGLLVETIRSGFAELMAITCSRTGCRPSAPSAVIARSRRWRNLMRSMQDGLARVTWGHLRWQGQRHDSPLAWWVRSSAGLADLVSATFDEADTTGLDYFDGRGLRQLLRQHARGRPGCGAMIARIFGFLLWFRLFAREPARQCQSSPREPGPLPQECHAR